ncbi:hypothetical protein B1R27_27155 [Streptomyces sp. GKU 895]|nr:hypothetical protein B1R27_27155 [Streptomyces sp. GKU 895]
MPLGSGQAEVGGASCGPRDRRADERGRQSLAEAVADAVAEPGSADALGALRQVIRRALSKDPGLEGELAALLPRGTAAVVVASGERSIAAGGEHRCRDHR